MVGSISAQIALLAFAAAIIAGLAAGNSPTTVLTRALVTMFVALMVSKLVTWTTKLILRDHLQRKKHAIDRAHLASLQRSAPAKQPGDESSTTVGTG
jgi:ABC-type transport system involved in cytochrome bd biosynthesis fused ATPase/permease subunit